MVPAAQRKEDELAAFRPFRPSTMGLGQNIKVHRLVEELSQDLNCESRKATYTCGGKIPILVHPNRLEGGALTPTTEERVQDQRVCTKGVMVRWGADGHGRVITLPIADSEGQAALEQLIQDCQPATFGRGGEDVYDETYRRAGAMGVDQFTTDFCPYEAGIIDIVAQLLLPSITGDLEAPPARPRVSPLAEKYNLTFDQEAKMHYAIHKTTRQRQAANEDISIFASDIQPCLEKLDVLPANTKEMLELIGKLDPSGTGWVPKDALLEVLAQRISAKAGLQSASVLEKALNQRERLKRMSYRGIGAELYKLNVYSGPNDMFRAHVDTPRGANQFGALVVCLPFPFEGGGLAVRHQGQAVLHNWAALHGQDPAIQWAAFYSDCDHEVLPVTAGHRITLTYNLFITPGTGFAAGRASSLEPIRLPLFINIQKMLADQSCMHDGGYLGIYLAHSYPHTHPNLYHFVPRMLKGADMALYESFYAAGLKCKLQPINPNGGVPDLEDFHNSNPGAKDPSQHVAHPKQSNLTAMDVPLEMDEELGDSDREVGDESDCDVWYEEGSDIRERALLRNQALRARNRVVWLNQGKHEEMSKARLAYGNEAQMKVNYTSVAMLVQVPSSRKRCAKGTEKDPVRVEE